jgi:hypothetical protein
VFASAGPSKQKRPACKRHTGRGNVIGGMA